MQLRAYTEKTVVQSIQDEIVFVNLESGLYYFLSGCAALIFCLLDSGCPRERLLEELSKYYDDDVQSFVVEINSFVDQLLAESLLIEGVGTSKFAVEEFVSKPFSAPVLNKCEDLQDLLLLDPVYIDSTSGGQA